MGHARASFPQPWCADEQEACFIVRDANGQALAYVYFEVEPGRRTGSQAAHPRRAESVALLIFMASTPE